jgi:anhydro-N-acetylmuramic acid kinase
MLIIGLMSGTSADGVDAALVFLSGEGPRTRVRLIAHCHSQFSVGMREEVILACDPATTRTDRLCALNTALAHEYARAATGVAEAGSTPLSDVDAVACHGQTIWHQPTALPIGPGAWRGTTQIGSPAALAHALGVPVVSDFRSADMAAGGQGAPLVPFADVVLFADVPGARAVQNIGGIANVTYLPPRADLDDVIAFDTGPGNMVIDAVVSAVTCGDRAYDAAGAMAALGRPDQGIVRTLMAEEPFFAQPPPKSTGRETFGRRFVTERFLPVCRGKGLRDEDTVSTATEFTVQSIADAYRRWVLPKGELDVVVLGGGGARNRTLRSRLSSELAPARVATHADFGIPDEAKEAVAFAILAYESLHGRPSNVPSATGASRHVVLGSVTPAPGRPWPTSDLVPEGRSSGRHG